MAQTRKKRRKKRRGKTQENPALLLLGLVGALMMLLVLFRVVFSGSSRSADSSLESAAPPSPEVTEVLPASTLSEEYFGEENGFKTYSSPSLTGHIGIDVSSHQAEIDWAAVRESGVEYAMIRVGYRGYSDGGTNEDSYYRYNIESALENGLDVGVYFFSQALTVEEATHEANTVLELVEGYDLSYPIYFDWEPIDDDAARTNTISSSELTQCAKAFCETIENAGYSAGVYFNLTMAVNYYHLYTLKEYSFWLAEYESTPSFPFHVDMWQYSSSGDVSGIEGRVDLNLSFIDPK